MQVNGPPIVYFDRLEFADGTDISPSPAGVVVVIGPNNVGKSTFLVELGSYVRNEKFECNSRANRILRSGSLSLPTRENLNEWFDQFSDQQLPDPVYNPSVRKFRNWGYSQNDNGILWLEQFHDVNARNRVAQFFVSSGREAIFDGQAPDYLAQGGGMPIQDNRQFEQLFFSQEVETRIRQLSIRVFGVPVYLFRGGRQSVLHWGKPPVLSENPTPDELAEIRAFPRVNEQGEGVRALLQMAITLELGIEPFVLLDEPDAHLHPPQARIAGRFVADRGRRSQVFIVTHSVDFLLGVLDGVADVTIVRLDRVGDVPRVKVLDVQAVKQSWTDTVVRYSGVLAGLMHKGVVLCESEADCLYYEVVSDELADPNTPSDLRFIQCGGKTGIKKLLGVLVSLKTPVSVVTDFDLLRDWGDVASIFQLLGGNPSDIRDLWTQVDRYLSANDDQRTTADVLDEIAAALTAQGLSDKYSVPTRDAVTSIVRLRSTWADAKRRGLDALRGPAATDGKTLLERLAARGLHVLPFGELESLHPEASQSLHGPQWVIDVLERGMHRGLREDQRDFVRRFSRPSPLD